MQTFAFLFVTFCVNDWASKKNKKTQTLCPIRGFWVILYPINVLPIQIKILWQKKS